MPGLKRKDKARGGAFNFRVSDVVEVPLRGTMLRLRLANGSPSVADLGAGSVLRLRSPAGVERSVTITGHTVTGGRVTQERLERVRELDVLVSDENAATHGPVEIGWFASGPAA